MKLVVGLGNVGKRYTHTRHNIGFMVVDELAKQLMAAALDPTNDAIYGSRTSKWSIDAKTKAEVAKVELDGQEIILAKPQTMMNGSGEAVKKLMQKYRASLADTWVIYDDVDVDFGKLRIRNGATSGQQGIRSITAAVGNQFVHARMGISLNDRAIEPSEVYVLRPFNDTEQVRLPEVIIQAGNILAEQIMAKTASDETFTL